MWLDLIKKYAYLPVWSDPEAAPWPGLETWISEFDRVAGAAVAKPSAANTDGHNAPARKEHPAPQKVAPRTWTDASGLHQIEAAFVGMTAWQVRLRKADGAVITIPLEKLSEEDQKWIASRARGAKAGL